MDISFLIVTRQRPEELKLTLQKLQALIDLTVHEVLVYIDSCQETEQIMKDFNWVHWYHSPLNIGASPARNELYQHAKGQFFIGLDDDAHPLSEHFIFDVESRFRESDKTAIIAFQEVRGLYENDRNALEQAKEGNAFLVNEFIGCGFAIRKDVYEQTNGFPVWMDIYGEESALSLEVLDLGYDISYDYSIIVNHRVDVKKRKLQKRNYFRFEKQLVNTIKMYLVYYKSPTYLIIRSLFHNFRKYALQDLTYFRLFLMALLRLLKTFPTNLSYRKPVQEKTIKLFRSLKAPFY
jgi:GT2 family glycosyltransferase